MFAKTEETGKSICTSTQKLRIWRGLFNLGEICPHSGGAEISALEILIVIAITLDHRALVALVASVNL